MKKTSDFIWYASYGSNINQERFYCYIRGGEAPGSNKIYTGCRDTILPIADEEIYIQASLYFAKSSSSWKDGGVGFLKNSFGGKEQSWGRMYLITKEQFIDVVKQETNRSQVDIDFDHAIQSGDYIFAQRSWYGKIIYLGKQEQHPIFTFTNETDLPPTMPDAAYLKTIATGIKQVFPFSNEEIATYFLKCDGVKDNYDHDSLMDVINS